MDKTSIQAGVSPPNPAETAVQTGLPPVGTNGTAAANEPAMKPKPQAAHPAYRALVALADLRITVVLFALSMLLVFWGTLAQADFGNLTITNRYFRNFLVMVPIKVVLFNLVENKVDAIPFPGGLTIGFVMLANLLAAHAVRFKLAWNRAGIILIHVGIIIMMLGEFLTYLYATEASMIIPNGHTVNYVVDARHSEIAVVRTINDKKDEVVVVPGKMLTPGAKIHDDRLPFDIEVIDYMVNSSLRDVKKGALNPATRGRGLHEIADLAPEVSGVDPNQMHDIPSAYVRLTRDGKDLGAWLLSVWYTDSYSNIVQPIIMGDGKKYQISLRYKQTTRPFHVHLYKVTQDFYPGTETPKDYRSYIRVIDPPFEMDTQIYMNAPMFYQGESFYQASVTSNPQTRKPVGTVLQVVRNPGWLMPYLSCLIVGVGLLMHFGLILYKFLDRRIIR
jgi:hypothetical protein